MCARSRLARGRYAGVFEAVKIRKGGYPFRLPHAVFAQKYRWIARKEHGWVEIAASPTDASEQYCHAVLTSVHQDFSQAPTPAATDLPLALPLELAPPGACPPQVRIGRSLVLYRAEEHRVLELLKNLALGRVFQHMQASFRRKMGRVYRRLLATAKTRPHACENRK